MKHQPQFKHIQIEGVGLEYYRVGEPAGDEPTLLFLHNGLGSAGLWRDFPARLCSRTDLPALVYSRRGHGGSQATDWPRRIDFLQYEALDVVPKLLDELGIGDVICVGHSEGASISLVLAATLPERVKAIVIESAHVYVEQINLDSIEALKPEFLNGDLRRRLQRHHGDNVDCAFHAFTESWLNPDFKQWSIEKYVPKIGCPVLAIRGSQDEYISTEHFEHILELFSVPAQSLVMQVGHAPHEEQPDLVLDRIESFIRSI